MLDTKTIILIYLNIWYMTINWYWRNLIKSTIFKRQVEFIFALEFTFSTYQYISSNHEYLTLEDRIYNELNKEISFKHITRFLCKSPTTISKKIRGTDFPTGIIKAYSIMPDLPTKNIAKASRFQIQDQNDQTGTASKR